MMSDNRIVFLRTTALVKQAVETTVINLPAGRGWLQTVFVTQASGFSQAHSGVCPGKLTGADYNSDLVPLGTSACCPQPAERTHELSTVCRTYRLDRVLWSKEAEMSRKQCR